MDNNNKDNITIGRPKAGGAVFWAPAGTPLPTSAEDTLDGAFVNLGYVTEDGLTISTAEEGDDIKAWGPEDVMHSQTGYSKTASLALLETSKIAVLQFLYGDANVTANPDGTVAWDDTGDPLPRGVMVVDTLQNNASTTPRIKRQVLGDAQFIDRSGDHVYNNSDPLSYPIVMKAFKFTPAGETKQTYIRNYLSAGSQVSA